MPIDSLSQTPVTQQSLGSASPEWHVAATGDFDHNDTQVGGDSEPPTPHTVDATRFFALSDDLLWGNVVTGQLQEWQFA
jgi:hypothetical protein